MSRSCHCPGLLHSYNCDYYVEPAVRQREAGKYPVGTALTSAGKGEVVDVLIDNHGDGASKGTDWESRGVRNEAEWHAHELLSSMEAWERTPEDHRAETPKRFVKALQQLTTREDFNFTTFPAKKQDMVTLAPIPFYTLCAHHIVPFFGNAYVSYVPDQKLAGLSKFARTVRWCAKGFWVQEELTDAIADYIEENLQPLGVGVVLKAEHMCMAMRGVGVAGVLTTTSTMRGVYADHDKTAKAEFLELIKNG